MFKCLTSMNSVLFLALSIYCAISLSDESANSIWLCSDIPNSDWKDARHLILKYPPTQRHDWHKEVAREVPITQDDIKVATAQHNIDLIQCWSLSAYTLFNLYPNTLSILKAKEAIHPPSANSTTYLTAKFPVIVESTNVP